ncbi:hypothetical protein B0H14DRAFT_2620304 [Mycena olivaceomarginata]|nr:hypothetical protein B0H14DRAFT_2620304 [Mycena olivaceomarginata]
MLMPALTLSCRPLLPTTFAHFPPRLPPLTLPRRAWRRIVIRLTPPTDALGAKGVSGVTFTLPQGANVKPCFSLSDTLRWFQSTYDVFVVSRIHILKSAAVQPIQFRPAVRLGGNTWIAHNWDGPAAPVTSFSTHLPSYTRKRRQLALTVDTEKNTVLVPPQHPTLPADALIRGVWASKVEAKLRGNEMTCMPGASDLTMRAVKRAGTAPAGRHSTHPHPTQPAFAFAAPQAQARGRRGFLIRKSTSLPPPTKSEK